VIPIMKRHVVLSLIAAGLSLLSVASANAWSVATNVPGTAITSIPAGGFAITKSGNYYLATNLTVSGLAGIVVEASEVTIDLNGRTLSGAGPAGFQIGILVLGEQDVIVQQGDIDKFAYGILWLPGIAGVNAKNRVEDVNFNNNEIAVMSESGTSNWVKQCVIDGGDVGVLLNDDIGSRVSHSIFEEQQASQSVGVGTAILTEASRGNLFDENLIAHSTSPGGNADGIIASSLDKVRFDSFVNYTTTVPIIGAKDLTNLSEN
jgi:hypothetical protein